MTLISPASPRVAEVERAAAANLAADDWVTTIERRYSPDQPRDEHGRWSAGGASAKAWADASSQLTGDRLTAAIEYTGGRYREMNGYLRAESNYADGDYPANPPPEELVAALQSAIAQQSPTDTGTVLYRGVPESAQQHYADMEPGARFTEPGFTSTTTDLGFAERAGSKDVPFSNPVVGISTVTLPGEVLEIHAPAGTRGLSVNNAFVPTFPKEHEVVLQSGSEYLVREQREGRTIVDLVPHG